MPENFGRMRGCIQGSLGTSRPAKHFLRENILLKVFGPSPTVG